MALRSSLTPAQVILLNTLHKYLLSRNENGILVTSYGYMLDPKIADCFNAVFGTAYLPDELGRLWHFAPGGPEQRAVSF